MRDEFRAFSLYFAGSQLFSAPRVGRPIGEHADMGHLPMTLGSPAAGAGAIISARRDIFDAEGIFRLPGRVADGGAVRSAIRRYASRGAILCSIARRI